jgi:hypothetical protein
MSESKRRLLEKYLKSFQGGKACDSANDFLHARSQEDPDRVLQLDRGVKAG